MSKEILQINKSEATSEELSSLLPEIYNSDKYGLLKVPFNKKDIHNILLSQCSIDGCNRCSKGIDEPWCLNLDKKLTCDEIRHNDVDNLSLLFITDERKWWNPFTWKNRYLIYTYNKNTGKYDNIRMLYLSDEAIKCGECCGECVSCNSEKNNVETPNLDAIAGKNKAEDSTDVAVNSTDVVVDMSEPKISIEFFDEPKE